MKQRSKNRHRVEVTLADYKRVRRYSGRNRISMAQAVHELFRSKSAQQATDRESELSRKKTIRMLVGLAGQIAKTNSIMDSGSPDSERIGEIYRLLLDLANTVAGKGRPGN